MSQIDLTFLKGFTGGNPDKMKKYIQMFINMCPAQLQTMKTQLDEQNYDGLRGTAHALKPQITYMGIKEAEPLIKSIETMAGGKTDVEKLPAMLNDFTNICESAMEQLKLEIA